MYHSAVIKLQEQRIYFGVICYAMHSLYIDAYLLHLLD